MLDVSLGSLCFCSLVLARASTGSSAKQSDQGKSNSGPPTTLWELFGQRRAVSHAAEPCSSRNRAMLTAVKKNHPAPISCSLSPSLLPPPFHCPSHLFLFSRFLHHFPASTTSLYRHTSLLCILYPSV